MISGDNIHTAIACAKLAGIVDDDEIRDNQYACMTGKEFRNLVGGVMKTQIKEGVFKFEV